MHPGRKIMSVFTLGLCMTIYKSFYQYLLLSIFYQYLRTPPKLIDVQIVSESVLIFVPHSWTFELDKAKFTSSRLQSIEIHQFTRGDFIHRHQLISIDRLITDYRPSDHGQVIRLEAQFE